MYIIKYLITCVKIARRSAATWREERKNKNWKKFSWGRKKAHGTKRRVISELPPIFRGTKTRQDNKKNYTRTDRSKKRIYRKISKKVFANYQRIRAVLHTGKSAADPRDKRFVRHFEECRNTNWKRNRKKKRKRKGKKGGKIILDSRITRLTCENVMRRRNVIKIYINWVTVDEHLCNEVTS